jgi:hypothetical protein
MNSYPTVALIDEKACFAPSLELALELGVQVKILQPKSENSLDAIVAEASNYDIVVSDGKLFLYEGCISNEPPEQVNGIVMSPAAKFLYESLTQLGKTVLMVPMTVPEEACHEQMRRLFQQALAVPSAA